jgi:hypothetical protein
LRTFAHSDPWLAIIPDTSLETTMKKIRQACDGGELKACNYLLHHHAVEAN